MKTETQDRNQIGQNCYDGIVIAKLINLAAPGTIDSRVLSYNTLNVKEVKGNHNVCINSALAIGILQNIIRPEDFFNKKERTKYILAFMGEIIQV